VRELHAVLVSFESGRNRLPLEVKAAWLGVYNLANNAEKIDGLV